MSKHKDRWERRDRYHKLLDAELSMDGAEKYFVRRVLGTLDRKGLDFAPDGRLIKADFWRFIESRRDNDSQTARAGECLVEKAIALIQVKQP